jgi:hypothetical protein
MERTFTIKSIIVALIIVSSTIVSAQTTHTVILTCDTSDITKENVNEVCNFGQDRGVSNEDYTISVNLGDVILWRGIAINERLSSSLKIKEVTYQAGKNVFGEDTLKDRGGLVSGEIIQGRAGDEEKYNIQFIVYVGGHQVNGPFVIDPKIKIMR